MYIQGSAVVVYDAGYHVRCEVYAADPRVSEMGRIYMLHVVYVGWLTATALQVAMLIYNISTRGPNPPLVLPPILLRRPLIVIVGGPALSYRGR